MESLLPAVITALAGVLTKLGIDSRPNRLRRSIEHTLTVAEKARSTAVPEQVVTSLDAVLVSQSSRLMEMETKSAGRRLDWGGFFVGIFFTSATGIGAWNLATRIDGWYWTALGIVVGLFGIVLLGSSFSALFSGPRKKK